MGKRGNKGRENDKCLVCVKKGRKRVLLAERNDVGGKENDRGGEENDIGGEKNERGGEEINGCG